MLPPLLTRKVGTLSLFCDVWRRRRCSKWVCNVLEVGFRLRFCVSPHDGCPICICRQGLYREVHSPPVTDTVHATNNVVEVVCDTTSPGFNSHLFLEIPHFTVESAESIRRSLPRDAWVTSIDIVDNYFNIPIHRGYQKCLRFRLGTPYTNSGHCHLAFLQHLGYSPRLWQRSNAGTRNGHQSLSVPGRLAHLFTNSRPVPPRHCISTQSLTHDGHPHSRQEVGTYPKTETFVFWDTSLTWFPSKSLQLWIDITKSSTDLLIPAKPRRMCSYVADPARSL